MKTHPNGYQELEFKEEYTLEDLELIHQCVKEEGRIGFPRNKHSLRRLNIIEEKLNRDMLNHKRDVEKARLKLHEWKEKKYPEPKDTSTLGNWGLFKRW